ncbi:uncharacterized protein DS421_6g183620 [Arachis hypogaea]|nr:uncharacterized protein DS421_6g183620 [Arachis hypogaea]
MFHLPWVRPLSPCRTWRTTLDYVYTWEPVGECFVTSKGGTAWRHGNATGRRPRNTPTVCEVFHPITNREVPDDKQVEQLGPSTVAAPTSGLSAMPWIILGLGGACMDVTPSHYQHVTLPVAPL